MTPEETREVSRVAKLLAKVEKSIDRAEAISKTGGDPVLEMCRARGCVVGIREALMILAGEL